MPVTPTYPGVYIEEVPSAVKSIASASTSIGAFVGFTLEGPVNSAQKVRNFGEFERTFGGLTTDSPLSWPIKQFFDNGGGETWVVRVAKNAVAASVQLRYDATNAAFRISARGEGAYGNTFRVDIGHGDASNPVDLFTLKVQEFLLQDDGTEKAGRLETFPNLSMDPNSPAYAIDVVNATSALVELSDPPPGSAVTSSEKGTATSGVLTIADLDSVDADHNLLGITINGEGPHTVTVPVPAGVGGDLATRLGDLATKLQLALQARPEPAFATATVAPSGGNRLVFTSGVGGVSSSVQLHDTAVKSATRRLKLLSGVPGGGTERSASAKLRPRPNGTLFSGPPNLTGLANDGSINVQIGSGAGTLGTAIVLTLWNTASKPATPEAARQRLESALGAQTDPALKDAQVTFVGDALHVQPGGGETTRLVFSAVGTDAGPAGAQLFGTLANQTANQQRYRLGKGATVASQAGALEGSDGIPPDPAQLTGSRPDKSGMFALEEVEEFNLLVIPGAHESVYADALPYVAERRAFLIIDVPDTLSSIGAAASWISDKGLIHTNAAAYFPYIEQPDPERGLRLSAHPPSGAVAGIYARTDARRGVWKAPAGTEATLFGVPRLTRFITDPESGDLNDKAVNALRSFRTYGRVVWGARTTVGATASAVTEWRYVPVRRTALMLETSLYRGLQWVVFEPNDEPLWAQIRLNVGAFMHNLFRQGAFQGASPRDAYLVKCDAETTTQSDIDRGIVNVLVGFAPLKPAEFVILRISQLAGQIQV